MGSQADGLMSLDGGSYLLRGEGIPKLLTILGSGLQVSKQTYALPRWVALLTTSY